ncbi:MAG: hypothetical protein ACE5HF_07835 [Gemmatimonadota bacterium]
MSTAADAADLAAIPDEIRSLLEERATFQDWLGKLGDLRAKYRPAVADRVESDYRERLSKVEGELATHRAELEKALSSRQNRAATLDGQIDDRRAELEEVELRHAVGEFDDAEWERRREEHTGALAEMEKSLGIEREAVAELEGVLGELTGARPVARPETADGLEAEVEAWEEELEEAPAGEPESAEDEEAEAPAGDEAADFKDELEFLESLSLDDAENFDAVSRMLDEDGGGEGGEDRGDTPQGG